jgi:hypothetical protein
VLSPVCLASHCCCFVPTFPFAVLAEPSSSSGESTGLPATAIAGITIGAGIFFAFVFGGLYYSYYGFPKFRSVNHIHDKLLATN